MTFKTTVLLINIIATLLLAAACSQNSTNKTSKAGHIQNISNSGINANPSLWPQLKKPDTYSRQVEERVESWLKKMTLEQKVGQMTQAEITWATPEDVKKYHLGSLLSGGGTFLHGKRHASVKGWVDYMDNIYDASMDTSEGGLAIPVTYGIDAVHGNNKFGHATIFPHNIGLGATRNPELLRRIGEITALEVLAVGIDWTFAPTLAVVRDDRWGRSYEGYSEDPKIVASYAKAMVEGVQGTVGTTSFLDDHHLYATAKHWIGDGGTTNGTDQGDNAMSEKDMVGVQGAGYFPALEAGIQSIMASHNSWHGEKLHGHQYLLTDILKNKLGFDGFVIGDWNAHANVKGCTAADCAQAINAGIDMFMVVEDYKAFIETTLQHIREGTVSLARIDDAVRRILRVKIRSGLFDKGRPSDRPYAGRADIMGSEAHREVARQAVRESLTLLKNNHQRLPLSTQQHVLVAGDAADNMAKQAGGWTISWQAEENTKADFVGATTILDGIRETVTAGSGTLEYHVDGVYKQKPDVAIVVFGESPYAEWRGDIKTLSYDRFANKDAKLLEKLKADGIPVVSIFISGRPLWMNREINASEAFVAAWLPGSEGKAIADVLFRKPDNSIRYGMTGKLSFSWPKRTSQTVLNIGDDDYDPLFPYGYGLSYQDKVTLAQLDTKDDSVRDTNVEGPYTLFSGKLSAPWSVLLDSDGERHYPGASRAEMAAISVMEADKNVQGDAKEFRWNRQGTGTGGFGSKWHQHDLSPYLHQGGAIRFQVRTIKKPEKEVYVVMDCSNKYAYCGKVPLSKHLASVESQEWRSVSIDLLCFAKDGVNFETSRIPFALQSKGEAALRIADVEFIGKSHHHTISCR